MSRIECFSFAERKTFDTKKKNHVLRVTAFLQTPYHAAGHRRAHTMVLVGIGIKSGATHSRRAWSEKIRSRL